MDLGKIRRYEEMRFNFNNKWYLAKLCSYDSKEGFNHKIELYELLKNDIFLDEILIVKKIARYINRTWERFTFESVILKAFNKAFKNDYHLAFNYAMQQNGKSSYAFERY
jgi:hypothetical protein